MHTAPHAACRRSGERNKTPDCGESLNADRDSSAPSRKARTARNLSKEWHMKTIAKSFVAVCLIAAGGAFAADTPAPASANETTALIESFPNMVTYEQLHRRD